MGPSPFAGGQQSFGTQTPFVPQAGFGAQTPFFGGQAPFAQGYDMLSGAWGAALQQSTLQQGIGIDDKTITEIIRDSIDLDPYIPLRDKNSIDVQASDGVVRLSGAVKSRRSKALAYLHAFACPAVTDVETQLKVEDAVTTRVQQPTSSRQTAAR
jgi:hypothetical protein